MNNNNIMIINYAQVELPTFKETTYGNDEWIKYGEDNQFPSYLINLANRSDIHNAIISSKVDYICGQGITYDKKTDTKTDKFLELCNPYESFDQVFRKLTYDYVIFGGFALNVIKTKGGIDQLYHVDFSKIRSGLMDEYRQVNKYFYSNCWSEYRRNKNTPKPILKWTPETKENSSLIYYMDYTPGQDYYPLPSYKGCLASINTNAEISNFHLAHIRNGMAPSFLINFPNGEPSMEEKRKIEKQVNEKFAGSDSAGNIIITFSDDATKAPTVTTISPSQLDKQFIQLEASTQQSILTGHKVNNPLIVGIPTPGKLGGSNEFKDAFNIYDATIISPMKNSILSVINKWGETQKLQELKVIPSQPIENTFSEPFLEKILMVDEAREEIGMEPLNINKLVNGLDVIVDVNLKKEEE